MSQEVQQTDIFAFTNRLLEFKEELTAELFLISKNYVAYSTNLSGTVQPLIDPLFLDPFMEFMFEGAETGMVVRDLATYSDKYVLPRADLNTVPYAASVIDFIEKKTGLEMFSYDQHDFKNMKAVAIRFTHKECQTFYVIKSFTQKPISRSGSSWQVTGEKITQLETDAAFKVPTDNQVVIIGNDIFVFNMSKFEKLFNYSYAKLKEADGKAEEFNKHFKISVPSGFVGIQNFLRESPTVLNKFLKTDLTLMDQEQVVETADAMGIEMMQDDNGAIILMDAKDFNVMLDIINDNYYESGATGQHYVAKSKKAIEVDES